MRTREIARRHTATVFMLGLLALQSPGRVYAEAAVDAYERGLEAYRAQDYEAAEVAFRAAQREAGGDEALSLALLYNLARTAEMRGRACDAAAAFDEFLASVAPDNVAEARHVEVARASREKARAACPPPPAPASVAVAPSPPTVAADPVVAVPPTLPVPPATPAIVAPLDVAQPEATRTASPWKWVAGAGALGALATGGTLLVIGYGELDDARAAYGSYQDATTDTERERAERDTKSADSSGRLHGTIGYVALGVGAALAGLTVWLFLRDDAAAPGAGVPDSGSASDPAMGFSF